MLGRSDRGGIVAHSQKWGGDPLAAEGRAILHTPPLSVFLTPSLTCTTETVVGVGGGS